MIYLFFLIDGSHCTGPKIIQYSCVYEVCQKRSKTDVTKGYLSHPNYKMSPSVWARWSTSVIVPRLLNSLLSGSTISGCFTIIMCSQCPEHPTLPGRKELGRAGVISLLTRPGSLWCALSFQRLTGVSSPSLKMWKTWQTRWLWRWSYGGSLKCIEGVKENIGKVHKTWGGFLSRVKLV